MYALPNQRPQGMQIHGVPESERYEDNTGRKLPWAIEFASPNPTDPDRKEPVEKGAFGRSMRRTRSGASRSRSKTAEPRKEEDRTRAENIAAEDAIFGSLKRATVKDETRRELAGDSDAVALIQPISRAAPDIEAEPTEVLLYGFGEELQWAAIDFYERVSNGLILEDYDRSPPGQRYDISRSYGRQAAQRSLSRAAMRKKNKFAGGLHWIKVTFDSRQAAELAIARQPHIIKGYLVYAEPFNGHGPQKDEAVFATQAGAQITSDALPATFATNTFDSSPQSSNTLSSATVMGSAPAEMSQRTPLFRFAAPDLSSVASSSMTTGAQASRTAPIKPGALSTSVPPSAADLSHERVPSDQHVRPRRALIEGTTRAIVLPAELALAPKRPKPSWSAWIGASEIIGSAVPHKEDGSFDWDRASFYWRMFYMIDAAFGTDFCGLRAED